MSARVYLTVPFERKDEVKALGGRWDPEVKLWWVKEGVETPFPVAVSDSTSSKETRVPIRSGEGTFAKRVGGYRERAPYDHPERLGSEARSFLNAQRNECTERDKDTRISSEPHESAQQTREEDGQRLCLRCGKTLPPINFEKLDGSRIPNASEKSFHASCYEALKEEDREFHALLERDNERRCRICRYRVGSSPRVIIGEKEIYHLGCYTCARVSQPPTESAV